MAEPTPGWLSIGKEAKADITASESDLSDWMTSLEQEQESEPHGGLPAESLGDESDLSWLEDLESSYPGMTIDADSQVLSFGEPAEAQGADQIEIDITDLPDWLAGGAANQAILPDGDENLPPGELPSWLVGMRPDAPVEPMPLAAGASSSEPVEGAGPLAGLRGVLPAEPDISKAEKPPVYSVRLQVSEIQETQAKILAELVAGKSQSEITGGAIDRSFSAIAALGSRLAIDGCRGAFDSDRSARSVQTRAIAGDPCRARID